MLYLFFNFIICMYFTYIRFRMQVVFSKAKGSSPGSQTVYKNRAHDVVRYIHRSLKHDFIGVIHKNISFCMYLILYLRTKSTTNTDGGYVDNGVILVFKLV